VNCERSIDPTLRYRYDILVMRIRSILATLPEVKNPENEMEVMPASPKTEDDSG